MTHGHAAASMEISHVDQILGLARAVYTQCMCAACSAWIPPNVRHGNFRPYVACLRFWPTPFYVVCDICVFACACVCVRARVCVCACFMSHRVGQNHEYIQCIYGILGGEITKYTVYLCTHSCMCGSADIRCIYTVLANPRNVATESALRWCAVLPLRMLNPPY
jgi:hypothetical protein